MWYSCDRPQKENNWEYAHCWNDLPENHITHWDTQPIIKRKPVGNPLLASSILFTGNTDASVSWLASRLNLQFMSECVFYDTQQWFLTTVLNRAWKNDPQMLRQELVNNGAINLHADRRWQPWTMTVVKWWHSARSRLLRSLPPMPWRRKVSNAASRVWKMIGCKLIKIPYTGNCTRRKHNSNFFPQNTPKPLGNLLIKCYVQEKFVFPSVVGCLYWYHAPCNIHLLMQTAWNPGCCVMHCGFSSHSILVTALINLFSAASIS